MSGDEILDALLPAALRVDAAIALYYERDNTGLKIEVRSPLHMVLTAGGVRSEIELNDGRLKKVDGEVITLEDVISLNGYGDDDVIIQIVEAWAESRGWVWLEDHGDLVENGFNLYLDHRYIVWACFKEYQERVALDLLGKSAGFYVRNSVSPVGPVPNNGRAHPFGLSIGQVLAVMDKEFTPRSDLWLMIFHSVWQYGYSSAKFHDGQLLRELSYEIADVLSEALGKFDDVVGELFLGLTRVTVDNSGMSFTESAYTCAGALSV